MLRLPSGIFHRCAEPAQPWIELLNGATWPVAASRPATAIATAGSQSINAGPAVAIGAAPLSGAIPAAYQPYYMQAHWWDKLWFDFVLALRTMVNLSGVVGVLIAVFAYRRLKESAMFMVKVEEIQKVRDLSVSRGVRDALLNAEEKQKLAHDEDGKYFEQLVNKLGQRFEQEELPTLLDGNALKSLKEFTIRVG